MFLLRQWEHPPSSRIVAGGGFDFSLPIFLIVHEWRRQ
jgi:hypothetical protein